VTGAQGERRGRTLLGGMASPAVLLAAAGSELAFDVGSDFWGRSTSSRAVSPSALASPAVAARLWPPTPAPVRGPRTKRKN